MSVPFVQILSNLIRPYYFIASSTATATATDAPTIGLLPIPISPIISTCAGTDEDPANCASECILPIVSVIPYEAGPAAMLSGCNVLPVPPPEATENYFLPASFLSFLYVPATGCWNLVGFVELPVIETSTSSIHIIATPSLTSFAP